MRKLLIVKTGTTFPSIYQQYGDFEDFIMKQIEVPNEDIIIAAVYENKVLPKLADVSAAIITGSHAMVTDREAWSVALAGWLRDISLQSVPVLCICYGHQLIADALGGAVDYHPAGKEIGTVDVRLTAAGKADPLLGSLPETFPGHVFHAQTVRKLPANAKLLAYNSFEPHHAYVVNDHIWGVQFHPEFNAGITRRYIEEERQELVREGYDAGALYRSVTEHAYGKSLLQHFIRLAG